MKHKKGNIRLSGIVLGLFLLLATGSQAFATGTSTNAIGIATGLRFYSLSASDTVNGFDVNVSVNSTMLPLKLSYHYFPQGLGFSFGLGGAYSIGNGACASVDGDEICSDYTDSNSNLESVLEANLFLMPTLRAEALYMGIGMEASRVVYNTTTDSNYVDNIGIRFEVGVIPESLPLKLHIGVTYNPILINELGDVVSLERDDVDLSSTQIELGATILLGSSQPTDNDLGAL